MCLSPIQIINPTKYISLRHRDQFLMSVPCGKCAECQQTLSNQWFLRAWQECLDAKDAGAFLYFDTLTYKDSCLPLTSDIIPDLPKHSCFRSDDIRHFIESLRIKCKRKGFNFRYFLSSEYGTDDRYTHRPHYHILFWVYGDVSPLVFSRLVSCYWKKGRTDGVPYKPNSYVLDHNVITSNAIPAQYLRACRYVTKYVQKSCLFDKELNKRVNDVMYVIANKIAGDDSDKWLQSVHAQRVRMKLKRSVNQFHRQSQHFGENLLSSLDLGRLFEDGVIFMPSPKGVKVPVPLCTYFKRKLFYDLVVINGSRVWQLNKLGVQFRDYRRQKLIEQLANTFHAASSTYHLGFGYDRCLHLADYVYNYQGRIKGDLPSTSIVDKLSSVTLFNYVTLTDKEKLGHRGIVNQFIGNSQLGYSVNELPPSYSFKDFIAKYVIIDDDCERDLAHIYYHLSLLNERRQSAFVLTQRLENIYKMMRENSTLLSK